MNQEDMKRIQNAEAHRARLKSTLDRGGTDRAVVKALGQTAAAFADAYQGMWKRLEGGK